MKIERLACIASSWLGSPVTIVPVQVLTVASIFIFGVNVPLMAISILSLMSSQLVLLAGAIETRAVQAKLDELIKAIPGASNEKIGIEKK